MGFPWSNVLFIVKNIVLIYTFALSGIVFNHGLDVSWKIDGVWSGNGPRCFALPAVSSHPLQPQPYETRNPILIFNFSVAGFLVNINFRACDNCQIANFTKQKLQNAMSVLKSLPDQKIKRCLSRWKLFGKQLPLSAFRRERWKAAAWTSSSGRGNICRHLLLQSKFLSLQYSWQNVTRRLPWMGGRVSET